jgi:hypothetical protein
MIVQEKRLDFNSLEKKVYGWCCLLGCEIMKEVLEAYDWNLAVHRDRTVYRHKGLRKTVTKTIMGEVEYKRAVYTHTNEDGVNKCVFLLDEEMGLEGSGCLSGIMQELIANACCDGTYRSAAKMISEMTGQSISHTAVWNVIQAIGEELGESEKVTAEKVEKGETKGNIESKVLFEEQDGIWLKMQGESRKEHGANKEMKLAIAYDGANEIGKDRFELTNKVACANFEGVTNFHKRKEGAIASVYNIDEIEMRFLNGDGAEWIKYSVNDSTTHFQLDPFHRNKAIKTYVKDPVKQTLLFELLHKHQIDALLSCIEGYINCLDDFVEAELVEKENLQKLLTYFTNNKDALVPYHKRGLTLPEPSGGKVYRRMGAMESNIFTIIGNRMKGRRACWSIKGGNNLARILCLKFTNRLSDTLRNLSPLILPAEYTEEIILKISAAKVPLSEGKGYNGFKQTLIPSSMKWLKELVAQNPFV